MHTTTRFPVYVCALIILASFALLITPQISQAKKTGDITFPDGTSVTIIQNFDDWLGMGAVGQQDAFDYIQWAYHILLQGGHANNISSVVGEGNILQVACTNGLNIKVNDAIPNPSSSPNTPSVNSPSNESSQQAISCTQGNFCKNGTRDLYRRDASCNETFVQTCAFGCANDACLPPPPQADLTVTPKIVQANTMTTVAWTSKNTTSCNLSGSNGDGAGGTWSGKSGSHRTSPITQTVIYTLTCTGNDSSIITEKATVQLAPIFHEE